MGAASGPPAHWVGLVDDVVVVVDCDAVCEVCWVPVVVTVLAPESSSGVFVEHAVSKAKVQAPMTATCAAIRASR